MAKKFGRIEPVRIEPELAQGTKDKKLVEAINLAFDQIVTQTNDVLQRATARLMDSPLWMRCEWVKAYPRDAIIGDSNHRFVRVRHNLGVIPRHAIIADKIAIFRKPGTSDWVIQQPANDPTSSADWSWTDNYVFFRVNNTATVDKNAYYDILLIP